ncbi:J domain-containing protein [Paenibacillus thailandensis]|uniref:J domain-containing protein n=1 Tax=Paenibacillus thailandensis TaxID=393250 RepID=A0ABW5QXE9_9BACL
MDELKEAYRTLGLPENATRDEVEKRYETLLRKARAKERSGEQDDGFAEVTKAYRCILDFEDRQAAEQFNQEAYGKYKKMAGTAEKLDHFWRYYKFHVFGGIIVIALIVYGITAYMDHKAEQERLAKLPPVDVSVMLLGNYFTADMSGETEPIEESLLTGFPNWKRFEVLLNYMPLETANEMDIASQQKAVVLLATEKPDVYVMDKASFEWLVPQGILTNLDDMAAGEWKTLLADGGGSALKRSTTDDPAEHVYAIDVTGTKLANSLPIVGRTKPVELVIGIRVDSPRADKAMQFIQQFMESGK